jgi:uncharacterized protein
VEQKSLTEKEKMRLAAIRDIQFMHDRLTLALRNFDVSYELATIAAAAANAAHEKPIASILQSFGDITVNMIGTGEDLKRVHRVLRQRNYKVANRHVALDNSYASITYATDDSDLAGKVNLNASFPLCERVKVGEQVVPIYKTVCGDSQTKFPSADEIE